MAAIDDINALEWPQDMNAQGGIMLQLLGGINDLLAEWGAQIHPTLQINQPNPPTTADWESLWIAEGNAGDIPLGARLLWYNTTNQAFGGYFMVSEDDEDNLHIVRAENIGNPGKGNFMPWNILTTSQITVNNANVDLLNPVTIVLTRPARVIMKLIGAVLNGAPGAEPVLKMFYKMNGVDYIVNSAASRPGLKAWTERTNVAGWKTRQLMWAHPDLLSPGTYQFDFWAYSNDNLTFAWGERNPSSGSPIVPAVSWEIIYQ